MSFITNFFKNTPFFPPSPTKEEKLATSSVPPVSETTAQVESLEKESLPENRMTAYCEFLKDKGVNLSGIDAQFTWAEEIEKEIKEISNQGRKEELESTISTLGEKIRSELREKKQIWLPVFDGYHTQWIHIDLKKGIVSFYTTQEIDPPVPKLVKDPLTQETIITQSSPTVIQMGHFKKSILNSSFIEHLIRMQVSKLSLNPAPFSAFSHYQCVNSLEMAIQNYLEGEEITLPSQEREPFFYRSLTDPPLPFPVKNRSLFWLGLALSGKSRETAKTRERIECLENASLLIHQITPKIEQNPSYRLNFEEAYSRQQVARQRALLETELSEAEKNQIDAALLKLNNCIGIEERKTEASLDLIQPEVLERKSNEVPTYTTSINLNAIDPENISSKSYFTLSKDSPLLQKQPNPLLSLTKIEEIKDLLNSPETVMKGLDQLLEVMAAEYDFSLFLDHLLYVLPSEKSDGKGVWDLLDQSLALEATEKLYTIFKEVRTKTSLYSSKRALTSNVLHLLCKSFIKLNCRDCEPTLIENKLVDLDQSLFSSFIHRVIDDDPESYKKALEAASSFFKSVPSNEATPAERLIYFLSTPDKKKKEERTHPAFSLFKPLILKNSEFFKDALRKLIDTNRDVLQELLQNSNCAKLANLTELTDDFLFKVFEKRKDGEEELNRTLILYEIFISPEIAPFLPSKEKAFHICFTSYHQIQLLLSGFQARNSNETDPNSLSFASENVDLNLINSDHTQLISNALSYIEQHPLDISTDRLDKVVQALFFFGAIPAQIEANPQIIREAYICFDHAWKLNEQRFRTKEALEILGLAQHFKALVAKIDPSLVVDYPDYQNELVQFGKRHSEQKYQEPFLFRSIYLSTIRREDLLQISPLCKKELLSICALKVNNEYLSFSYSSGSSLVDNWLKEELQNEDSYQIFLAEWLKNKERIGYLEKWTKIERNDLPNSSEEKDKSYSFFARYQSKNIKVKILHKDRAIELVKNKNSSNPLLSEVLNRLNFKKVTGVSIDVNYRPALQENQQLPLLEEYILETSQAKEDKIFVKLSKEFLVEEKQVKAFYRGSYNSVLLEELPYSKNSDFDHYHDFITDDGSILIVHENKPLYILEKNKPLKRLEDGLYLFPPKGDGELVWGEYKEGKFFPKRIERDLFALKVDKKGRKEHTTFPGYFLINEKKIPFQNSSISASFIFKNEQDEYLFINEGSPPFFLNEEIAGGDDFLKSAPLALKLARGGYPDFLFQVISKTHFYQPLDADQQILFNECLSFTKSNSLYASFALKLLLEEESGRLRGEKMAPSEKVFVHFKNHSLENLIKLYIHFSSSQATTRITLSHEEERRFLIHLNNRIRYEEQNLIERKKSIKKEKKDRGFYSTSELKETEAALKRLQSEIRPLFELQVAPRIDQLQKRPPSSKNIEEIHSRNRAHNWALKKIVVLYEKVEHPFNEQNQLLSSISAFQTEATGSELLIKFDEFNPSKKWEAYLFVRHASPKDRKKVIDLLQFRESENAFNNFLIQVARSPNSYPTSKEVVAFRESRARQKEILKNKLDKQLEDYESEKIKADQAYKHENSKIKKDYYWNRGVHLSNKIKHHPENAKKILKKFDQQTESKLGALFHMKGIVQVIFEVIPTIFKMVVPAAVYLLNLKRHSPLKKEEYTREFTVKRGFSGPPSSSTLAKIDSKFDQDLADLTSQLLPREKESPAIKKVDQLRNISELEAEVKKIEEFDRLNSEQTKISPTLEDIKGVSTELESTIKALETSLKTSEQALIQQAFYAGSDSSKLKRMAKGHPALADEWKLLQKLVYKGQMEAYQKHLLEPTDEKIATLESGFLSYLTEYTRLNQLYLLQKNIKKAEKAIENKASQEEIDSLLEKVYILSTQKRAYIPSREERHLLFFEAMAQGLYRPDQLTKAQTFVDSEDAIQLAEMFTGFGKTDFLIPTINEMQRVRSAPLEKTLKKILVDIWPSALERTNTDELRKKTKGAFHHLVEQFSFSRSTQMTSTQLEFFSYLLDYACHKGLPVNVKVESVHSLTLHYLEILYKLKNGEGDEKELEQQRLYFEKILILLLTRSKVMIDESHQTMAPNNLVVYTIGVADPIPDYSVQFAGFIFDQLLKNPSTKKILDSKVALPKEEVNDIVEKFVEDTLPAIMKQLKIDPKDEFAFKAFVEGSSTEKAWLNNYANAKEIHLAKGYIRSILASGLQGAVGVDFGLSKLHLDTIRFAIPYEGKDKPKEAKENPFPSCFQNVDLTLLKTFRTYYQKGIPKEELQLLPGIIYELYEKDLQLKLEGNKSPIFREVEELLGVTPDFSTSYNFERQFLEAIPGLSESSILTFYIKYRMKEQIKQYPATIPSSPQDILNLIMQSLAVSATPQQKEAYGLAAKFHEMEGSLGKMYSLLAEKTSWKTLSAEEFQSGQLLKAVVAESKNALIDPNALLKDYSNNLEIAKQLAAEFKELEGNQIKKILFYDKKLETFLLLDVQNPDEEPIPFNAKTHNPEKTFTLYDPAFGTNIVQKVNASGVLLLGETSTLTDACQAIGRLRELHLGQSIDVWMPEEVATKHGLYQEDGKTIDLAKVFKFLKANQEKADMDQNKLAFQQMMHAEVRGAMIRKLIGLPIQFDQPQAQGKSIKAHPELFGAYQNFLIPNADYDPETSYGGIGEETEASVNLTTSQKQLIGFIEHLEGFTPTERIWLIDRLRAYEAEWQKVPLSKKDPENIGLEVQALQDQARETHSWNEEQLKPQSSKSDTRQEKEFEWPKEPNQLFSQSFFKPREIRVDRKIEKLRQRRLEIEEKGDKEINSLIKLGLWAHKTSLWFVIQKLKFQQESRQTSRKSPPVSFFPVRKVLKSYLPHATSSGARFFSSNFLISSNFADQFYQTIRPYGLYSKPLSHLLVIQDTDDEGIVHYTTIAVDPMDTRAIHSLLFQDQEDHKETGAPQRRRKIGLYDLNLEKIIHHGADPISPDELKQSHEFQELLVQAKVLSGKINFSEKEEAYLLQGIQRIKKKKGVEKAACTNFVALETFIHMESVFIRKKTPGWTKMPWVQHLQTLMFRE